MSSTTTYHLAELRTAFDVADPRRAVPSHLEKYGRILDIGCGAGQTLIAAKLTGRAVGVDVDHSALLLGRRLQPGLQLTCANGESLPLKTDSFDLVICRVALPYMHRSRALAEMFRVTRPGGTIWLLLHPVSMTLREFFGSLLRVRLKSAVYRGYVMANGLLLHLLGREFPWPLSGRHESFQTASGMRRALQKAGFEEIEVRQGPFIITAVRKRPVRSPAATPATLRSWLTWATAGASLIA